MFKLTIRRLKINSLQKYTRPVPFDTCKPAFYKFANVHRQKKRWKLSANYSFFFGWGGGAVITTHTW